MEFDENNVKYYYDIETGQILSENDLNDPKYTSVKLVKEVTTVYDGYVFAGDIFENNNKVLRVKYKLDNIPEKMNEYDFVVNKYQLNQLDYDNRDILITTSEYLDFPDKILDLEKDEYTSSIHL